MLEPDDTQRTTDSARPPDPSAPVANSPIVAFLVAPEGVEQVELVTPWHAVVDAGARPRLISTQLGEIQAFNGLDRADTFPVDQSVDDVDTTEFSALVLPGGVANPDYLRIQPGALALVRDFFERGLPVAVICHGAWTLIDAGVVGDRDITSWPSLATDLRNAGAKWVDEEVVVCRNGPNTLISSRKPDDLTSFCAILVDALRRETARA
ncbi:MAG: type 1 glutamine amidotransferase domain-containing protein [Gordonia sp. (in: high G+C Gram-positive bacteria)]|uniref:type 1 glutamine amidotransferase domain-containing protein n=1 Tax=Gordonia sp. (in: high G+C Gram-positive bacteria) TaxID=84139 RepID=UPI003BB4CBE0